MRSTVFNAGIGELLQLSIDKRIHPNTHTFRALSCVLGFLLPIRFLSDLIASFGATVLDLMTSDISRFNAMSSLADGNKYD